ncbi:hypothetical protein B0H34DRAFT_733458 [Crassisporium funariophilum]|nr:hypothetical protein B0H34DRAFT_733458 [Crassisporium funariophilum]
MMVVVSLFIVARPLRCATAHILVGISDQCIASRSPRLRRPSTFSALLSRTGAFFCLASTRLRGLALARVFRFIVLERMFQFQTATPRPNALIAGCTWSVYM